MSSNRSRCRPTLEALEGRLALSTAAPADTLAVLTAFTKAYQSHPGEANYNPALDLNHNHQIAQSDGKLLLRSLPPLSPDVPLRLTVSLTPADTAHYHHPTNSGGVTFARTPTVIGHTTPGALIFTGTGTLDLKLRGPAYVSDARGDFAIKVNLTDGINQFDMLVVDAHGHQLLRAYPILWLGFGRYEAAHPRKT